MSIKLTFLTKTNQNATAKELTFFTICFLIGKNIVLMGITKRGQHNVK